MQHEPLSYDKSKEIFSYSQQGILEINFFGKILIANPQAASILGLSVDRASNYSIWDFFDSTTTAELKKISKQSEVKEVRLQLLSGEEKWIRLSWKHIYDSFGNINFTLAFLTDITGVRKSRIMQKLVTDSLSIGVWEYNVSTGETYWGEGNYKLFDLDPCQPGEISGIWKKMLSQEDYDRVDKLFKKCVSSLGTEVRTTVDVTLENGVRKHISIRGTSIMSPASSKVIVRGVSFDITELEDAKRRLDLALESLKLGLWEYKRPENIISWSPMQYKIFGQTEFDGTIEKFMNFLIEDDRERIMHELSIEIERGEFNTTFKINNPATGIRDIRARAYAEKNRDGEIVRIVGINWDITEEVQKEVELERQRLLALNQARLATMGEMAAGIAHEVNNPLAIIVGNAEMLLSDLENEDVNSEKLKEYCKKILGTSGRIQKIIKGLKSLSRDPSLDPFETQSLVEILKDSLNLTESRLKAHGITVYFDEPEQSFDISCRPVEISQVFINLINNSIDALKECSNPWISIELSRVNIGQKNQDVLVSFTDNGTGITPDVARHIMNPFFTTKSSREGTGLGLSISENIVKAHHGSIRLDQKQKFTRFLVQLPLF